MELFNLQGQKLDEDKLEVVSNSGSECVVYKYQDSAVKLFRKNYPFKHLTLDELLHLKSIKTQRILMPTDIIFDEYNNLVGFQMPFIAKKDNILEMPLKDLFKEMAILEQDAQILTEKKVGLFDMSSSNFIFNGKVYVVDFGNFAVDDIDQIKSRIIMPDCSDDEVLKQWNTQKIDELFDHLMFFSGVKMDAYQFRLIAQFFLKEKEKRGISSNLDVLKLCFNPELSVNDAIHQFLNDHIVENPAEREWYLNL